MTADIGAEVVRLIGELLEEDDLPVPDLRDDTVLLETGLDSLGFAVLVTRLEESLGYDPFSLMSEPVYPVTVAEFVGVYRDHAPDGEQAP
jgi:acyl carrier protein